MIRVLYIARYHNAAMERKIALLAQQPDLSLWLTRPRVWKDDYGRMDVRVAAEGYRVHAVDMLGNHADPHRALYRSLDLGMRAARPHVIHAEEEPDSLAALQIAAARRLLAPRARFVLHTWQNINRPKSVAVRWVTHASFRAADAILCANAEAMAVLRAMGYQGTVELIPPQGVDTRVFAPRQRLPADVFTILFVGRLVPEKGLDTLLQAMEFLAAHPVRLELVGDGPLRAELAAQIGGLGLGGRVVLRAPVTSLELAKRMAQADVLVLPSRTTPVWKEQFGRVLVEAMACGLPVVGSDSGAIPEVIGEAGLVFPEGDAGALAERLLRLIASHGLRASLAQKGLERVRALYSQESIAQRTADYYRRVAGAMERDA